MIQYYLCQDCLKVIVKKLTPKTWKKYHQTPGSCPTCKGDMCGCSFCQEDAKQITDLLEFNKRFHVENDFSLDNETHGLPF